MVQQLMRAGQTSQTVPEGVSNGTHGQHHMQLCATALYKHVEKGSRGCHPSACHSHAAGPAHTFAHIFPASRQQQTG